MYVVTLLSIKYPAIYNQAEIMHIYSALPLWALFWIAHLKVTVPPYTDASIQRQHKNAYTHSSHTSGESRIMQIMSKQNNTTHKQASILTVSLRNFQYIVN